MPHASQRMILIRFLDWMRGILTIEPRMDDDVIIIPLQQTITGKVRSVNYYWASECVWPSITWFSLELVCLLLKNLPGGAENRESHGEADTEIDPGVWADAVHDIFPALVGRWNSVNHLRADANRRPSVLEGVRHFVLWFDLVGK